MVKKILSFTLIAALAALLMPLWVLHTEQTAVLPPEEILGEEPPVAVKPDSAVGYDAQHTVTVLLGETVEEMPLETYLIGVLAAEMPAAFPVEALKAQAVAARTYTLYKEAMYGRDGSKAPASHKGAVLCGDSSHCKAYCDLAQRAAELWGSNRAFYESKLTGAVRDTDGLEMEYEGKPIAAVFHAASAEKTEAAVDVWGNAVPYLVSVSSPGGEASSSYHAKVELLQSDFAAAFQASHPKADLSGDAGSWFSDIKRSAAGGIISLKVGGVQVEGREIRSLAGLNSTNFTVEATGALLVFSTTGYGHGVGMSQYGARALALEGKDFESILKHYYTGVDLSLKSDSAE